MHVMHVNTRQLQYSHTDGAFTEKNSLPITFNLKWLISLPKRYYLNPAILDLDSHWDACPNKSY